MSVYPATAGGGLRWGIMATGGIARTFTKDLQAHGHVVQAVGSRTAGPAEQFAAELSVPTAHGSYGGLVADPDVDIVYVATPHFHHEAGALAALEQGKHVLVEKAFTLSVGQAERVTELARSRGLVVMEAMWTRFLPHMVAVREMVHGGRLGEVVSVHADHTQQLPTEAGHRLNDRGLGGGALLDLGVYPVSFAVDLLGAPVDVQAVAKMTDTGVDATVATAFRHEGGAVSTTYSSMRARGRNRATILGTEGRIEIAATWYAATTFDVLDGDGELVEHVDIPVTGRGMQYQAAEVERLVTAGLTEGTVMPPEQTVLIMRTLDQVRSAIGLRYPGE